MNNQLDNIFYKVFKRVFDLSIAIFSLFFFLPMLIVIAISIKITSKGPVFFKQKRLGLNGKAFYVWKFRTMTVLENGNEVKQAVKNDPRVTVVGSFLRKTSLDEFPQFINVLIGNMSVVGPRPHAIAHDKYYEKLIGDYALRQRVKPGITGLAQVKGCRGETSTLDKMEERIRYDLEYIDKQNLLLDFEIVLLTFFTGFSGETAY